MITKNDYEKSVIIATFVKEIRDTSAKKKNITDLKFTPVSDGYEISFMRNTEKVRVTAFVKGFFGKRLMIQKYVDGKISSSYRLRSIEEISRYTELILTE